VIVPRAVFLVRHGETEWSLAGFHTGRKDIPLTSHGEEEARKLSPRLRSKSFQAVFCSPLRRAARTCEWPGFSTSPASSRT
jgi:probable phosphoglycerate mutase